MPFCFTESVVSKIKIKAAKNQVETCKWFKYPMALASGWGLLFQYTSWVQLLTNRQCLFAIKNKQANMPEPIAFKCCFLGADQDRWGQG